MFEPIIRFAGLKKDVKDLRAEFEADRRERQGERGRLQKKRFKLLCGTLCFTYMEGAIDYVYTDLDRKSRRRLYKRIDHIKALEEEVQKDAETMAARTHKLAEFKEKYWQEELESVIEQMKRERYPIAHPISERDDDDPPTPTRMKEIIQIVYPKSEDRSSGHGSRGSAGPSATNSWQTRSFWKLKYTQHIIPSW